MTDLNLFFDDYIMINSRATTVGIHASEVKAKMRTALEQYTGCNLIEINEEIVILKSQIKLLQDSIEEYKADIKRTPKPPRDLDESEINKLQQNIQKLQEGDIPGLVELLGTDAQLEDEELIFDLHAISQPKLKELRKFVWKCLRKDTISDDDRPMKKQSYDN